MIRTAFVALILALTSVTSAQMGPRGVIVATVEKRNSEMARPLVASVEPVTRSTIAAEQEGILQERFFDEGHAVEKGALLSKVKVDLIEKQRDAARGEVKAIEGQIAQTRSELANAGRELKRVKLMVERNAAPEKEMNDALTRLEVWEATILQYEAQLAAKTADVGRLDLMVQNGETKSPMAGIVSKRHVEVGEWIEQGDAIAELVQLDPLFVRVDVPEGIIARIKLGDEAQITIDALGGSVFTGVIDQILPEADSATRTFAVKLKVANPDLKIRPGFFARLTLSSIDPDSSFAVPRDAIVSQGTMTSVVVVREGKAAIVPVTRLGGRGDSVWVSGDLKEGEQVVIRGNEGIMPGDELMVQNQGPPTGPPSESAPATQAAGH